MYLLGARAQRLGSDAERQYRLILIPLNLDVAVKCPLIPSLLQLQHVFRARKSEAL